MDVTLSDEDLAFREEIRAVFRDEFPDDIRRKREKGVPMERDDLVCFQQWLHEASSNGCTNTAGPA
jgi:hypothetical protein